MTLKTLRPKRVLPYDNKRELSSRLREENSRLKTDVARLRIEKAHLRTKNVQLHKENLRLKEELHFTTAELDDIRDVSDFKDIELAQNNVLYHILQEEHLRLHFE
ncbi:MAG: hypothetical protein KAH77_09685 [Thiomargarita sp.]|nr:hypothetical protein [Thiomargarita sp.]